MDHSCDPGLHLLAQALTKDLDLSNIPVPQPPKLSPIDDTATIFKNGTIITMACEGFRLLRALPSKVPRSSLLVRWLRANKLPSNLPVPKCT